MQTLDPRIGNQRQKGLMARVAAKAMARKGYVGKVGTFGKLANAGKMTRGLRPNRGPGQSMRHARPGGYGDILDGLNRNSVALVGVTQQYVNTAPTHAALPDWYAGPSAGPNTPPQGPVAPYVPGQAYQTADPAADYTASGGTSADPNVANAYNWGVNYGNSPEAQNAVLGFDTAGLSPDGTLFAPSQDVGLGAIPPLQQPTGPSAPVTTPGGLIPLGAGRYYDPKTDRIMGAGTGGGRLDQ